MEKLKFAIAGCGRIAERHAEQIVKQASLVAVCDIVKEKADNFGHKYGARVFYDLEDLLNNIKDADVISICTPNGLHADHTIRSLRNDLHVLCEKPMAISVYDCGEMIKEAEKANKRLFIVKQNRYNPPVRAIKDAIDDNKLGKIFSIQLNC